MVEHTRTYAIDEDAEPSWMLRLGAMLAARTARLKGWHVDCIKMIESRDTEPKHHRGRMLMRFIEP